MTSDPRPVETVGIVGVVGAGTMGAGIAQLALEAGHEVVLHDVDEAAIARGRSRVGEGLARRAARLDLDEDSVDAWVSGRLARMRDAHSLDAVGAEAEVVIEAALEDLDLKRTIFATLDAAAAPDVILATNSSALSVAAIARRTRHPERILGLHFFNPAPVMTLVEVVVPMAASPVVAERAFRLLEAWGKTPVRCADTPGFIVNRVNRPFTIQALRLLEAGQATVVEVDEALHAAGFPMGPFELMDLVGLDVNLATALGVWEPLGRPERLRPSPIQEGMVAEGRLGRKTGIGFYRYQDGRRQGVADTHVALDEHRLGPDEIRERILSAVDAEAREAVAQGVATPADIDLAMRAGAGHPVGPFERAARSGSTGA
ncbi:MAG: 3-hydroxyacyl-CoA dehydrogenase NAD-binding domain-containing protein [Chloroflexota bacterium]